MELYKDLKSRQEVRDLVSRAVEAQEQLARMEQQELDRIVEAAAKAASAHKEELGRLAQEETGFGKAEDKAEKNRFASEVLLEAIRPLKTVGILRKDPEKKLWDIGVPVGVIAGIVPSTNPTSTVIYKTLIALKSGNAIVFSPHPGAKHCTLKAVQLLAEAAEAAGCPAGAVSCLTLPTMEAVDELMKHSGVRLILATGGSAMVRAAYSSGTPAIGVGAGNGPAYLHPGCDLRQAVADILRSKTFDNGTICASEQSVIVEEANEQEALAEFQRQGAVLLDEEQGQKLAKVLFRPNGGMNPKIVGKSAAQIAKLAGLGQQAEQAKVLLARENGAGKDFPYSMEKLCPVLGWYRVKNQDEALQLSCDILRHEGSGHTFVIHSMDPDVVQRFALRVPVSRFLVNTPAALGGIGLTTGLFPALTLGCGAVGGSSSSNNIGPLDLINIRRAAWGHKEPERAHTTVIQANEELVRELTQKILQKLS